MMIIPTYYKKLEKTAIVLFLMSLTYPAFADIHERPWQDKVYNDFLTWDEEIQRFPDCPGCGGADENSPIQKFYFYGGAKIDASSTGTGSAIYLNSGVDFTVYLGDGKDLTLIGKDLALNVDRNSSATFQGKNSTVQFGSNEWDNSNSEAIIYLGEGAKFNVDAHNMYASNGSETNLKLFDNAKANIKLTGDFISSAGGTGIAIENDYSGSDTNISIDAKNIQISTVDSEQAERKSGLYLLAYKKGAQSNLSVNLTAESNLNIAGLKNGIQTFGSSRIYLTANDISVSGKNNGIYLYGYHVSLAPDVTVASGAVITSKNSVFIEGESVATYLRDRSTLDVNSGNTAVLSGDYISSRVENNSRLNVTANSADVLASKSSNWAFFVDDNSSATLKASKLTIVGKSVFENGSSLKAVADAGSSNGLVAAYSGSVIDLNYKNDFSISVDDDPTNLTISATGTDSQVKIKADRLTMKGELQADNNGIIDIIAGMNSQVIGAAKLVDNTGAINIVFDKASVWRLSDSSELSYLKMTNSTLDFSSWKPIVSALDSGSSEVYRSLRTRTWAGNNNTLKMKIDLGKEDMPNVFTDQFIIAADATGSHIVDINIDGSELVPEKLHSINWLISQGEGSNMTITNRDGSNTYSGRGMVSVWSLGFVKTGEETLLDTDDGRQQISTQTNGNGPGKWYLVKAEHSLPDPVPSPDPTPNPNPPTPPVTPPLPPEVNDNITIGTSSGQAEAYQADMEDLRKRTGEVRYGTQDGGWVSVFGKKDSVKASGSAGFKQEIYGLNIGVDRLVHADEDSAWLLGGAFRYSDADQKGLGSGYTTGTLQEYSGKLYATWMHDKGSYADFVLQAGRYEQELEGFDNTGMDKSKADYGTWGFGASVEVGHMFSFDGGVDDRRWFNHWFLEPQLQLSYFLAKGADYTTSTGLKVDQGNADFLTGRAGFVLGKKFNYGTVDDLDRRYFQVALLGGVKHEFLGGDQTISYTGVDGAKASVHAGDIDGTRFYYGVNCDWQVTDNFRLYAQASREEGDRYTKDYDISIGGKLLF